MLTFGFDQEFSGSGPGSGEQIASESVLVSIIDDNVLEGNQDFYITLESSDAGVDLSLMNTTEVTIIDNDGMHCISKISLF